MCWNWWQQTLPSRPISFNNGINSSRCWWVVWLSFPRASQATQTCAVGVQCGRCLQNCVGVVLNSGLGLLPRQILQEREINTRMVPRGRCLIYTKDSYMASHGNRDPEKDDDLKPESIEIPSTGQKIVGFKVPGLIFSFDIGDVVIVPNFPDS